jgi:hypothetical protein
MHRQTQLGSTRQSYPTLRPRGKSAATFPPICDRRTVPPVTHPPRKSRLLPHEKNVPQFCLRFVATKSHEINARRGPFSATLLKRFTRNRISHHTARHAGRAASRHAAQVLQAAIDFRARESARHITRIKRLKRRAFSLPCARRKPRPTFTSPQRA